MKSTTVALQIYFSSNDKDCGKFIPFWTNFIIIALGQYSDTIQGTYYVNHTYSATLLT